MRRILTLMILLCLCPGTPWAATSGVAYDIEIETSDFMKSTSYYNLEHLTDVIAPEGAFGSINRAWNGTSPDWYIDEQRFGADLIAGGIAKRNTAAIDKGLLVLRWGFKQQQPDGGFSGRDAFHGAALFVEASAHAVLLLKDSDYADTYGAVFKEFKPKLQDAARWLMRPDIETKGKPDDAPYSHRRYLMAAALGQVGALLNNQDITLRARDYAREGIKMQSSSGYNLERGGWDSSYQATGMLYASRYYTIATDPQLKTALYNMLEKAAHWETERIDMKGIVTPDDNTCIGAGAFEKDRTGKVKEIAVGDVYKAFYYWSRISGNAKYEDLARKIAQAAVQWHPAH